MFCELPLLLCVNLQNHLCPGDGTQCLIEGTAFLELILTMQVEWRRKMWPIAHLKRTATSSYFTKGEASRWIERVQPHPPELVFQHSLPSAYSSKRYAEYMQHAAPNRCIVVGCALQDTVLSTIIDGYHRGHRYEVIRPAVACKRGQAASLKNPILEILRGFCTVID